MDKTLAETVYQMATKFGDRPYRFIAPELADARNMLSIDVVVAHHGMQAELEMQREIERDIKRKQRNQR